MEGMGRRSCPTTLGVAPQAEGARSMKIMPLTVSERSWCDELMMSHFGSARVVSRGKLHDASDLPGLVAVRDGARVGLIIYLLEAPECEIVALVTTAQRSGVGRALVEAVDEIAAGASCDRLVLVTTNDNVSAQRFYEACGFRLAAVHTGAVTRSRALKPEIPLTGEAGMPIEDELEFHRDLVHT
jgi:GNAT superfamily N-acetyltransferase